MKCYLCDAELKNEGKPFRIGAKEEIICVACYTKTVNRRQARDRERTGQA